MPTYHLMLASALIALMPLEAQAQDQADATPTAAVSAPAITAGSALRTSDGKRAGKVFSVDRNASGDVTGVALIGPGSALVRVPIATITPSADGTHFVTSLTYKQIFR